MKKIIKIGLSASVVFTLMFATSVNLVAQEKVVASDNVEVSESVGSESLQSSLNKLEVQSHDKKLNAKTAEQAIDREALKSLKSLKQDYIYFDVEGNMIDINSVLNGQPCSGTGPNCAIGFLESDVSYPNGPSNPPVAPSTSVTHAQANYDVDLRQGLK